MKKVLFLSSTFLFLVIISMTLFILNTTADNYETVPVNETEKSDTYEDVTVEDLLTDDVVDQAESKINRNYEFYEAANENLDEEIELSAQYMPSSMVVTGTAEDRTVIQSGSCGAHATFILWSDGELYIEGTGTMENWSMSAAPLSPWYNNKDIIYKVTINLGITSIGSGAFGWCGNITTIEMPEGITGIANSAFYNCISLTKIEIPASVTSIASSAFFGCTSLESIIVDSGNTSYTSVDDVLFNKNMTSLIFYPPKKEASDYTIPKSVTAISNYSFSSGNKLTNINVAAGNTSYISIDGVLFDKNIETLICFPSNKAATSYVISNNVKIIGNGAFYDCDNLTNIILPANLIAINNYAFYECGGLTSVNIPSGVTQISVSAFQNCTSLANVTFLENSELKIIAQRAFYNCSSLTEINIPEGVTEIISLAFSGCGSLTSIEIPASVISIGYSAFYGCSSLNNINIPENVTVIYSETFYGCTSLESIVIPDGIISINRSAFEKCSKLDNIDIPASVEWIGEAAFRDCTGMTSIEFALGSKLNTIYRIVFDGCTSLTNIEIPEGVTSMGDALFNDCSELLSVSLPESITSIEQATFRHCSKLTSIVIPSGITSIGNGAFDGCGSLASIEIPAGVINIGNGIFRECGSLTNITVSESNTAFISIDGVLFTKDMTTIICYPSKKAGGVYVIPNEVINISNYAFSVCDNLITVQMPSHVASIGNYAFSGCTKLKNAVIYNPACVISSYSPMPSTATIYGYTGSTAQSYAEANGISFVSFSLTDNNVNVSVTTLVITDDAVNIDLSGIANESTKITQITFSKSALPSTGSVLAVITTKDGSISFDSTSVRRISETAGVSDIVINTEDITPEGVSDRKIISINVTSGGVDLLPPGNSSLNGKIRITIQIATSLSPDNIHVSFLDGSTKVSMPIISYNPATGKLIFETTHLSVYEIYTEAPTVDTSLNIAGSTLSVQSDISINYYVSKAALDLYDSFYVIVAQEKHNADGTTSFIYTNISDYYQNGNYYVFSYDGISAKNMNDTETTLVYGIKGSLKYSSEPDVYSVATYAYNRISKSTDGKMVKLAIDLLNYGAAAQIYFNYNTTNLTNSGLTAEQKAYANSAVELASMTDFITPPDNKVSFTGVSLILENAVTVKYYFNVSGWSGTVSDLTLKITADGKTYNISGYSFALSGGTIYTAEFNELPASKMRETITATFYYGDVVAGETMVYSIESYAYSKKDSDTAELAALVRSMMIYGDSASAYLNK